MATDTKLKIRYATGRDFAELAAMHTIAFAGEGEARLVALLHAQCDSLISLVAEERDKIVGHIIFSPCRFEPALDVSIWGLAPMAVEPERQRCGIGGRMIEAGIAACRERSIGAIAVLGHIDYYPRFGFRPASEFNLRCKYDVPPEAFMVQELRTGCLHGASGIVHYHPTFDEL